MTFCNSFDSNDTAISFGLRNFNVIASDYTRGAEGTDAMVIKLGFPTTVRVIVLVPVIG
jgi:hypothetical protein